MLVSGAQVHKKRNYVNKYTYIQYTDRKEKGMNGPGEEGGRVCDVCDFE